MPYFSDQPLRLYSFIRSPGDPWSPPAIPDLFLLVQKFGIPEQISRFDIITIRSEALDNRMILKRVIGLPGETVQIMDGTVYINGSPLYEPYFSDAPAITDPGNASVPIILGSDEYFVLGDNRPESIDSRSDKIGLIPADSIPEK